MTCVDSKPQQPQFAPIAPIGIYEQMDAETLGTYHLLLVQEVLAAPDRYAAVFRRPGMFIILDNGVVETGVAASADDMIEAANVVGADVVALADVLGDKTATHKASIDMYHEIMSHADGGLIPWEWMCIPQGTSFTEHLQCAEGLYIETKCKWWGIPRRVANELGSRLQLTIAISQMPSAELHLLGMSRSLADDIICCRLPAVRGLDSVVPALLGAEFQELKAGLFAQKRPEIDVGSWLYSSYTVNNIARIRSWLKRPTHL